MNFRAYRGRRVLVTGHTGFKGSWLTLWLDALGAKVTAIALPPPSRPNHWELLDLDVAGEFLDLRDAARVRDSVRSARPEIVFHLAAQSLVRRSYADPLGTWATNVLGTANVLDACRESPGLKAIVIVTTDKCYENREWTRGYKETDRLGGHDAYSASKAAAELVAASYRKAFFHARGAALVATARSGNVIGGGDWSEDRLVPDLARALAAGKTLEIRSPRATRPWLHVLEPLAGYLNLGHRLLKGERAAANAWNFGPDRAGNLTVGEMLDGMRRHWPQLKWKKAAGRHPHEATLLHLDSSKARRHLGWKPLYDAQDAIAMTAEWYRAFMERKNVISTRQLQDYMKRLTART